MGVSILELRTAQPQSTRRIFIYIYLNRRARARIHTFMRAAATAAATTACVSACASQTRDCAQRLVCIQCYSWDAGCFTAIAPAPPSPPPPPRFDCAIFRANLMHSNSNGENASKLFASLTFALCRFRDFGRPSQCGRARAQRAAAAVQDHQEME